MRKFLIAAMFAAGASAPLFAQEVAPVTLPNTAPVQTSVPSQTAPTPTTAPGPMPRLPLPNRPSFPAQRAATSTAEVPPDAVVFSLDGVCEPAHAAPTAKKVPCKTVLTRAQLEGLVELLASGAPDASRRQFAVTYARLLAASTAATKRHLDKDPAVAKELEAKMKFVRMQVLADALYKKFEEQADVVPASEIENYFTTHHAFFDQGELQRISFPENAHTISGLPLDPVAVKSKAIELQARAAAGEDFDTLQQIAYKDLGIKAPSIPNTKLEHVRRANLPDSLGKAFDLKPGEVSPVLESFEGLVVVKLVSKEPVSLDQAKGEIESILRQEHMKNELQAASSQIKGQFNLSYVQSPAEPDLFPPPGTVRNSNVLGKTAADPRARTTVAHRRRMAMPPGMPTSSAPANPAP